MSWGSFFQSAWNAASDAGKAAAAGVATGATWLGRKAVDAGRWTEEKVADAATWAANTAIKAGQWAKAKAIDAEHAAANKLLRTATDALGKGEVAASRAGDKVAEGWNKLRGLFGDKEPEDPVEPCPSPPPVTDVDSDGTIMAYPAGPDQPCSAMTGKGQPVTEEQISDAKDAGYESQSACCRRMRAAGMKPRTIVYVNGIKTDKTAHCTTLKNIGETTCARVIGVFNATEGPLNDLVEVSKDRALIEEASKGHKPGTGDGRNPAVDTLQEFIVSERRAGRSPEIWAHSQGGAIASLALYGARNDLAIDGGGNGLGGIKVKSLASAAQHWPDGPEYEHYVHVDDLTPVSFGLGDDPASDPGRAGKGASVIRFSGKPPDLEMDQPVRGPVSFSGNHSVDDMYLPAYKNEHGGCP